MLVGRLLLAAFAGGQAVTSLSVPKQANKIDAVEIEQRDAAEAKVTTACEHGAIFGCPEYSTPAPHHIPVTLHHHSHNHSHTATATLVTYKVPCPTFNLDTCPYGYTLSVSTVHAAPTSTAANPELDQRDVAAAKTTTYHHSSRPTATEAVTTYKIPCATPDPFHCPLGYTVSVGPVYPTTFPHPPCDGMDPNLCEPGSAGFTLEDRRVTITGSFDAPLRPTYLPPPPPVTTPASSWVPEPYGVKPPRDMEIIDVDTKTYNTATETGSLFWEPGPHHTPTTAGYNPFTTEDPPAEKPTPAKRDDDVAVPISSYNWAEGLGPEVEPTQDVQGQYPPFKHSTHAEFHRSLTTSCSDATTTASPTTSTTSFDPWHPGSGTPWPWGFPQTGSSTSYIPIPFPTTWPSAPRFNLLSESTPTADGGHVVTPTLQRDGSEPTGDNLIPPMHPPRSPQDAPFPPFNENPTMHPPQHERDAVANDHETAPKPSSMSHHWWYGIGPEIVPTETIHPFPHKPEPTTLTPTIRPGFDGPLREDFVIPKPTTSASYGIFPLGIRPSPPALPLVPGHFGHGPVKESDSITPPAPKHTTSRHVPPLVPTPPLGQGPVVNSDIPPEPTTTTRPEGLILPPPIEKRGADKNHNSGAVKLKLGGVASEKQMEA